MIGKNVVVSFPGGKKVVAQIGETVIATDQSVKAGGGGSAPEPFELFLASIATCSGLYALEFCRARDIDTDGLSLSMQGLKNTEAKRYEKFVLSLTLPANFPKKYEKAILNSIEHCAVKRHITEPPVFEFEITASV